jgi:hypothetical protein
MPDFRGCNYEDEYDAEWSGRYVPAFQGNHHIGLGNRFLCNVDIYLPDYTASYLVRRLQKIFFHRYPTILLNGKKKLGIA